MPDDELDVTPTSYLTGGVKLSRDAFEKEIKNGLGECIDKKPKHQDLPRIFPNLFSLLEVTLQDIRSMDTKR